MNLKENIIQNFKNHQSNLNGEASSIFNKKRIDAFNKFENLGFPSVKMEEWRYTNIAHLTKQDFIPSAKNEIKINDFIHQIVPNIKAHLMVFVNGNFNEQLSNFEQEEDGIIVTNFAKAIKNNADLINEYFDKKTKVNDEAFVAINSALANEGIFVYVPKNKSLSFPVYSIFVSTENENSTLIQPRNLLIAEQSSKVQVIQHFISTASNTKSLVNAVTEIYADNNANVENFILQDENQTANNITETQVYQQRDSRVDCHNYSLESGMMRNKTNMVLDNENIEGHLYGVYILNKEQHADNRTLADHAKPNCMSNELYKGIIGGDAKAVFNGRILVRQDAQKTNAYQTNRNILIGDDAQVNTKPQLEIFADDVKCSHGCTTGQLDEDAIFYLRSRGIALNDAKNYLLQAFAAEVTNNINIEELKNWLDNKIRLKIKKILDDRH